MPTTNGNRKILDLKRWEFVTPAPSLAASACFIASARHVAQQQLYIAAATSAFLYNPAEDGWVTLPNPALTANSVIGGCSGTAAAFSIGAVAANTTVGAASNNLTLPQTNIAVASTTGFPRAGAFYVDTASNGRQLVTYTAINSATEFGGCSGGTGTLLTNQVISFAGLLGLGGTTSTIITNQLLARDLRGYSVHIMSGPNAGTTLAIQNNTSVFATTTIAAGSNGVPLPTGTINVASTAGFPFSGQLLITTGVSQVVVNYTGITATSFTGCTGGTGTLATSQAVTFANVITVPTQASAFTTATVFRLMTPTWIVLASGTLAVGSHKKYDFATNTWTSLTITGLPGSLGTDGRLVATPSWFDTNYEQFATGTATSGSATTIVNSAKAWAVNQWTNYQIRIVSGTGAGQIRTIASNTATTITVSGWNTAPDNTSVYSIEGNDDFLYYAGNNAVALYRYSISNNTWTTLTPTVARAAGPSTGMSCHWIQNVSDSAWSNENNIINGRRLYSFRGGGTGTLDFYDIPTNSWLSTLNYAANGETFTTGTKYAYDKDFLYIQKDATGRWFRFAFATNSLDGWNTMLYPNGAAVVGDTAFAVSYVDGSTELVYVYMILNNTTIMLRQMVI